MIRYIYVVHSDINEEAVYNEFDILDDAIEFAEEVVEYKPYIEQVEVEVNDFGETTTVGEKEIVWKCKELVRDEEAAMTPEEEDAYWDREYNNMLATESEDELTEGVDWTTLRKLKGIEVSKILKILKPMISAKRYKYLKDNPQLATIVNDLGADEKEKLLQALKLDECLMNEALDTSLVDKEILNSNLPKILHQLTDQELADFNMLHNDEETIIEGGRFNIYDLHANLELQPYNSLSRDEYEALVLSTIPESYNEVAGDYDELFGAIAEDLQISVEDLIGTSAGDNLTETELSEDLDYDKLREELEENEDEVECQHCFDLVEKDNAVKTEHGYICNECMKRMNKKEQLKEAKKILNEKPDFWGLATDDELDAEEVAIRAEADKRIKDMRAKTNNQRINLDNSKAVYDDVCNKLINSSALKKLWAQLKNNKIVNFYEEWVDDNVEYVAFTRDSMLYVQYPYIRSGTGQIEINPRRVWLEGLYDAEDKELKIKLATKALTSLLRNLDNLLAINKQKTEDETVECKLRATEGLYKYFTSENVKQMTLIKDIANPGHWRHGNDFYLFVFNGKLYHFEAYDSGAYLPQRDAGVINDLSVFNRVKNTGNGDHTLPVIENLYNVFNTKNQAIYNKVDLNTLTGKKSHKLSTKSVIEDIKLEEEIKMPEVGTKIKIIHLEGEDNTYDGKVGVVESVDDENQLHGTWGGLAIIPDVDDFEIISEEAICKNNPVITHSDDDVKELKEGFSRYEVRTYYPEEPGPENFSYVYFDSLEEAEAYCQEHKASLAKSETSNSGIYEVEYLGGNGESAAPVKYVDKDGNLVDDEPASFDVNTVVEVITAIPKLTDSELVDKFNQIDPQLKAEYTDGKYFLFGKEVTKKDIVSQFITKWFDPETRATVEQLLGIQAIKESLTESATLEYYKKFVNSKSRDIDFMKRAGSDIYYVDEVAPGLHSVAELSEAELEELSEYVLKLGKTATDNYNNKLQKGNSKNTISNGIAESYEDYEEGEEISFLDWYDKVNYTDSAFLKGAGNKLEKLITFDENDDIKIDRKNEAALRELVDKFSYALYSRTQPVLIANGQIYTKSEPVFISKTDADYYAAEPRYQLDVIKYDVDISPEFFA